MNIPMTAPRTRTGTPLSALGKLTVGTLISIALMYVYLQAFVIKQIQMPLPIFAVISLVVAAIVAGTPTGGWRWTPLLGAGWSVFLTMGSVNYIVYDLSHPENIHDFAWMLVMLAVALICIAAGISATVQNYRYPVAERHGPHWLRWGLATTIAFIVGAVSVAVISNTGNAADVSPQLLATLSPITLNQYNGGQIRVKAGQLAAFRLENPASVGHSFDVDELNVHASMPSGKDSLALFKADKPGTYTFYCAPHYDKATGQGMHGTLIVEP